MGQEADFDAIASDALELLALLCRQPSVSAEGQALDATADLVEQLLADAGFDTTQLRVDAGAPAVYGEQRGRSDYTLLLYNHYDVQPVDPLDQWVTPPFEPTVRDGKLFARGAADNKGELAVRLAVVRALRERLGELPITLRWIIEGEEEILSPTFDELVRRNAGALRADGCLWEGSPAHLSDGRPSIDLGFKGALAVRLNVRLLTTDAHSSVAAVAPSAAWRLLEAVASLRDPDGKVRISGFYDHVKAPTEAELRALADGSEIERDLRAALGLEQLLDGVDGAAARERFSFEPTCNIAGFHSGYSGPGMKTVLPAEASAWLDFRLVQDQKPDEIFELLRRHLEHEGFSDVELTELGTAWPAGTPIEDPFVAQVARIAEQVTGKRPSISPRHGATLPIVASLERHLGVPGLAAPDNPYYLGAQIHAPNEHVRVEDVGHAVRFTYGLFEGLAADG
jgi:acetylornithine deacetylase/succinyl-diaminopimelate desuccinylase-like protein